MTLILFISFVPIFIWGCQNENKSDARNETFIDAEVILDAEVDEVIVNPVQIAAYDDGFALYDFSLHQIQIFTDSGQHLLSFGREGQGPGEFKFVSGLKYFSERFMVTDSERLLQYTFDLEGNLLSTAELIPTIYAIDVEPVSQGSFISPTNGEENTLAKYVDRGNEVELNLGQPVVTTPGFADFDQWQQDISAGRVPDFLRNRVSISAGGSYFYLFLQSEGILRQFDIRGNLTWEQVLELPEFEDEFRHFLEENKNNQPGRFYALQYVDDMKQDEEGIYLLLRTPDEYPPTIFFIDHNGEDRHYFRFTGMDHYPTRFSISPDNESIYFLNITYGVIYRSSFSE